VQRYRGEPVLTWWQGRTRLGHGMGEYVILDRHYRQVAVVRAGHGYMGDHHEFQLTRRGTAYMSVYAPRRADLSGVGGPRDGTIFESIVQEVDIATGRVVWEWHSADHLPVDEGVTPPKEGKPHDYFHVNAVDEDARGNLLISARNMHAIYALDKRTGRVRWRRDLGKLAASAPAYAGGRIYVTILQRNGSKNGLVAALRAKDGARLWTKPLPSRTESSPLFVGGRIYFGSEDGTVYALDAKDGSVKWRYKASGAVKGGLALSDGKLYFGDYKGRVYAIWADSGKVAWSKGTSGARFGLGSGQFYSTPAVAYGRVYLGNTDGNVYSYASDSGKLAWRKRTNGYVYASPAVAQVPGGAPTVYIGSYSGTFYALDARSGRVRWSYNAHGKISGASSVVGDIVYFSTINGKNTFGLGARTGRRVFYIGRGAYNPVVSDGRTIFLNGYSSLYALRPLSAKGEIKAASRRTDRRRASRSACLRKAERYHTHRRTIRRSYYRCVRRHHAQRR